MALLTSCKKASVYTTDRKYICDVQVETIGGEITTLIFPDDFIEELWTEVYVTFYDDIHGLLTYKCSLADYKQVLIRKQKLQHMATCFLQEQDSVVQRRSDIKIRKTIPITLLARDEGTKEPIEAEAVIKNLSAGGVFIESLHRLYVGDTFAFSFSEGVISMTLECEVLRTQDIPLTPLQLELQDADKQRRAERAVILKEKPWMQHKLPPLPDLAPTTTGYGCKFINLPAHKESVIRCYVFQEDILRRKKEVFWN